MLLLAPLLLAAAPPQSIPPTPAGPSWTDLADLTLSSPVILRATVTDVTRLGRKQAPDVPQDQVRALLQADVQAVIAAPAVLPARIEWLWQAAPDPRGRPAIARNSSVLIFAAPVPGRAEQLRLVAPNAQLPWTPESDAAIRAVLAEARDPAVAGLRVTGISDAFHAAGTVNGESESQFFITTGAAPLTLVLLRRAGAQPALRVATGELVDDSAAPVRPRTLLWRALACGLPTSLPARLASEPALVADWSAIRDSLGPCGRTSVR